MKLVPIVFAGSLAANVVLAVLHWRPKLLDRSGNRATASLTPGRETPPLIATATDAPSALNPAATQVAALWEKLRAEDLHMMVTKLRAAGFPSDVVRALIIGEVEARFAARRQNLVRQHADLPYWTTNPFGIRGMNPKANAALAELQLEQQKLLKDLLGPSAIDRDGALEIFLQLRFGDLSREKYDAILGVTTDYGILRSKLLAETDGSPLRPEERDRMAFLAKEERADLEKILTPAEMEAYELRSSDTANLLRRELDAFKPTESEFRAIFRATASAEKNYGSYTDNSRENRGKIGEEILARAKAALSPERFEQFRKLTAFSP
jgi:hypothetical protein